MAKKAPKKALKKKNRTQTRGAAKEVLTFAAIGLAAILIACLAHLAGLDGNRAGTALRMSEVMTANTATALPGADGWPDWIEIENASDAPVALTGCSLVRETEPSESFAFPGGTLAAGERVVVLADGSGAASSDGAYHAPFRLSSAGETILLLDASGNTLDRLEIPALGENQVYCRDESGAWQTSAAPTPGEPNRVESASEIAGTTTVMTGALEITEVMTENITFGGRDYVEIHNASDAPVSLSGWALSNDEAKLRKWIFPEETLEPDGYYIVECSGEKSGDGASFTLSSDGTAVLLTNPSGSIACRVDVPAQRADQACSLLESGWSETSAPTPGRANALSSADAFAYDGQNPSGVYLSEILTSSTDSDDWIELYNSSSQAVDLSGYGLSNNAKRPRKWQFPAGTVLQPGQYLGVYANGADDGLQTSYRLSAAGGYSVTLSDADGTILDRIYVSEQYSGVSYGRITGQSALRYFSTPTPGAANAGEGYLGRADEVVCSRDGGLFQAGETFTVEFSAPSDCKIYYTTDFTDPDETSTPYTGPITVSGQTILRARAFKDGCMPSLIATRSYLFDAKNGGTVYVVSVVSDPHNLTSDEAGILVRGSGSTPNYMMEWEPEAHVEVFDQNGNLLLSQGCGMRQQGQTCRAEPQQAFKLVARREYGGSNLFRAHLFSRRDYDVCHAFLLRPSNDDQYKTRMRDSVLVTLAEDTSVMYQETEVCVAYIDGEYWGHYNLREVVSPLSICQHEGWEGDEDALDLVKGNNIVLQGSDDTFVALVDWLKANDPSTDEAYRRIDEAVDIQNYIEYMAIQIYSGNTDPSNVKRYRNPNADGKWRWVLFDLDWGFNQDTNSISRWLTPGGVGNGLRTDNTFFIACMRNPTFRDRFLTHFGQQLATSFSSESILARFEARYNILKTILPDHWARWNETESGYNRELSKLISYANSRPTRLLQFLKYSDTLKLSQTQMENYFGDAMAKIGLTYDTIPKLK